MRISMSLAVFGALFATALTAASARAATYNFYFNNTEQGDHGNAQPTVIVRDKDDQVQSKGEGADSNGPKPAIEVPAGAGAGAGAGSTEAGPSRGDTGSDDKVVDADFEVVDEDKRKGS